jgi:hypothetical protein
VSQAPKAGFVLVIVGDGPQEKNRVLPEIAKKFNGKEKQLFLPTLSFPHTRTRENASPGTGVKASLSGLKVSMEKYGFTEAIIILDREHLVGINSQNYLEKAATEVGAELRVKHSSKHCYHCYFKTGGKQARVYIAISGGTTNIEEDIACLITELFGEKLDPSKAEIRRFLKEKRLRIEDLIKQATKEQLKRCFLGLTEAIEQLEQS